MFTLMTSQEFFIFSNNHIFFKRAESRPLFLFSFFLHDKYGTNTMYDKSIDGVLGTQTRAAGWQAQTNPLSYGGTTQKSNLYQIYYWTKSIDAIETFSLTSSPFRFLSYQCQNGKLTNQLVRNFVAQIFCSAAADDDDDLPSYLL